MEKTIVLYIEDQSTLLYFSSIYFTPSGERRGYEVDNADLVLETKMKELVTEDERKLESSRRAFFLSVEAFKELEKK